MLSSWFDRHMYVACNEPRDFLQKIADRVDQEGSMFEVVHTFDEPNDFFVAKSFAADLLVNSITTLAIHIIALNAMET